jgi:poly(3-hydroxybutyrate) depolymerase
VLIGSRVHQHDPSPPRPRSLIAQITVFVAISLVAGGCFFFNVPSKVHTITVGGMERTYRLYRPSNLPPQAPLVVVLHAALANTIDAETTSGFDKRARIGRFVVAYPTELASSGTRTAAAATRQNRISMTWPSSPL